MLLVMLSAKDFIGFPYAVISNGWKGHGNSFFRIHDMTSHCTAVLIKTCCMSPSTICHVRDRCGRTAGAAAGRGAPAPGILQVEQGSQTTLGPSAGGPPVSKAACFWKGTVLAAPERRLFPRRGVCDRGEERGRQRSA